MSAQPTTDPADEGDALLNRAGRWVFAKVWLGCLLSGLYAFSRHIGWPEALVTLFAVLGAVGLALAAAWLPIWTREYAIGIAVVDIGVRVVVWTGLAVAVVSLLIGSPAVGAVAGGLLLSTAWRTWTLTPRSRRGDRSH